jgi:hypothetical protein
MIIRMSNYPKFIYIAIYKFKNMSRISLKLSLLVLGVGLTAGTAWAQQQVAPRPVAVVILPTQEVKLEKPVLKNTGNPAEDARIYQKELTLWAAQNQENLEEAKTIELKAKIESGEITLDQAREELNRKEN